MLFYIQILAAMVSPLLLPKQPKPPFLLAPTFISPLKKKIDPKLLCSFPFSRSSPFSLTLTLLFPTFIFCLFIFLGH